LFIFFVVVERFGWDTYTETERSPRVATGTACDRVLL